MRNPRTTHPIRRRRSARPALIALVVALVATACGPFERTGIEVTVPAPSATSEPAGRADAVAEPGAATGGAAAAPAAPVSFEEAGEPGPAPFSPVPLLSNPAPSARPSGDLDPGATRDIAASETGPGLYGGTGTNMCDEDALRAFLASSPVAATAWAAALAIDVDGIETYLDGLTPATLSATTRVTNHGLVDGTARPFQSALSAGTAVLLDKAGTPRVRCACGNPLDTPTDSPTPTPEPEPEPTPEPTPERPDKPERPDVDSTPTPTPAPLLDFCATWAELGPTIAGGPSGDIPGYLSQSILVFEALIEAAEREPDFPGWAMADLAAYLDDLVEASQGDLTAGDVGLRTRVEGFLTRYCDHGARPNA